jgi:hypothetical protein
LSVVGYRLSVSAKNINYTRQKKVDMSSYRDLDIYKMGLELFYQTHPASLKLPKHEIYELGSQLRRASDSVITNIVEGY